MLTSIYQPVTGVFAIGLYHLLYQQVPAEKHGYSGVEQQRKLFLALDLEPSDKGRKFFIEQTSKLEAMGLLQSSRKYIPHNDDYIYEYQIAAPLSPNEFFRNQHFTLLLRDKVGKFSVLSLLEQFNVGMPDELSVFDVNSEDISVPFYDLFRLNTQVIDFELEQALFEMAPTRSVERRTNTDEDGYDYSDIILRFPRESHNRKYVEMLRYEPSRLAAINYVAKKYDIRLQEICRLLDEDGVFDDAGELNIDMMQNKANLFYRQGKKREEERERVVHKTATLAWKPEPVEEEQPEEKPVEMFYYLEVPPLFLSLCDIHQYNLMLRNEPYTLVLKRFFTGGQVPDAVLDLFEKIDLNYGLPEEVINVLIHYIHTYKLSWTKHFIESVVADMMGKQVDTYELAVTYIRESIKVREKRQTKSDTAGSGKSGDGGGNGGSGGGTRGSGYRGSKQQKPKIPIIADVPGEKPVTQEELEAIRKKAQKLTGRS